MVNPRSLLFLFFLGCMFSAPLIGPQAAAQTVQRDPQAVGILSQALSAAGGVAPLSAIQDFTASGTITYYWAGKEVQGSVTTRGRGTGQFRLDASLPNGVRSWAVNNGTGSVKEVDGTTTPIQYHNTINFGSLTFPFKYLVTALQDTSTSISYLGLVTTDGRQAYHIRLRKVFAPNADPNGIRSKLTTRDFFIDAGTFYVLSTLDMVHPKNRSTEDRPHEMHFSDYRPVNGILVPFSVTEKGGGQRLSTIQFNQISFNTGLRDTDFEP